MSTSLDQALRFVYHVHALIGERELEEGLTQLSCGARNSSTVCHDSADSATGVIDSARGAINSARGAIDSARGAIGKADRSED